MCDAESMERVSELMLMARSYNEDDCLSEHGLKHYG